MAVKRRKRPRLTWLAGLGTSITRGRGKATPQRVGRKTRGIKPGRRGGAARPIVRGAIRAGFTAGLTLLVGLATIVGYTAATTRIPKPGEFNGGETSIIVLAADGTELTTRGKRFSSIRLAALPVHLIDAVLAIEDRRFYSHFGVDPRSILRAAWTNLRSGRTVEGGSTITQQLAKNLFLGADRTLARKLDELLLALALELKLGKDEILELYLNNVYFGAGAYGVAAAADTYFGKSPAELSVAEAAMLAGLLRAPSRFAPSRDLETAKARTRDVIEGMLRSGIIGADRARAARQELDAIKLRSEPLGAPGSEYAADWVLEELGAIIGTASGRVVVKTTIDPDLQRAATAALTATLEEEGAAASAGEGAIVVLDPDGAVRAVVGGRSHASSQFNRVTQAQRQPGSAFKPFVFLAAIEGGLSPDSIASDEPLTVKGWTPRNYSGDFKGAVTLRDALAQSINSVAVRLYLDVGKRRVVSAARRLGITSDMLDGPSLALGTSEVTPLELTNAYVPFANGGAATAPFVVRRVVASGGRVLLQSKPRLSLGVIEARAVAAMSDMLQHTVTAGTGRAAAIVRHRPGFDARIVARRGQQDLAVARPGQVAEIVQGIGRDREWIDHADEREAGAIGPAIQRQPVSIL